MFTPNLGGYGYGWFASSREVNGREIAYFHHGGRINGFNSGVVWIPEFDATLIVLANIENVSALSTGLEALDRMIEMTERNE